MRAYVAAVEIAQNHLDYALGDDAVDKAIFEMGAAEKAMSLYIQEEKRNEEVRTGTDRRTIKDFICSLRILRPSEDGSV